MKKYDYSFLKTSIPTNIYMISNVIVECNTKKILRKEQYASSFQSLQKKAIIESVKGSNEMEGIYTTKDRLQEIMTGGKPITHNEKEMLGYSKALNLIYLHHKDLNVSEELITEIHKIMESESAHDDAGKYKTESNYIIEKDENGNRRVRFKPVEPQYVKENIHQLILAYMEAKNDEEIPDLLLIPCFVLDFLCIHPFSDGNGRVSRLLTVLMLNKAGYDVGRYVSYENMINNYKESYYQALEESSLGWEDNKNDYVPFMINFMQILYKCYKELDESFMEISLKKAKKNQRIEVLINSRVTPISKEEILNTLPDISKKTVESVLSKLLKEEKIEKIGTFKDARYRSRKA